MSEQVRTDPPTVAPLSLREEAALTGKTVAEVVAARLARPGDGLKRWGVPPMPPNPPGPAGDDTDAPLKPGDRLRKWAGSIDSGIPDLCANLDEYLGRSHLDPHD